MEPLDFAAVIALLLTAGVVIFLFVAAVIREYQTGRAEEREFLRNLVRAEISRAFKPPLDAGTVAPHHHGDGRYSVVPYADAAAYNVIRPSSGTGIVAPHHHGDGRYPAALSTKPGRGTGRQ